MVHYTFRFLNAAGGLIRMSFADRGSDAEAIRAALADAREPYALLEVWRGALVYRGTGTDHRLGPTKVEQYRNRAEELRTIAEEWSGPETRRMLLTLAAEFERMAETYTDADPAAPAA
jgi:hypothetical protein